MSKLTRKALLEQQIGDLEDSLKMLRKQLTGIEEEKQHEQIDVIEDYFHTINNRFANLQGFWQLLKEEINDLFEKKSR